MVVFFLGSGCSMFQVSGENKDLKVYVKARDTFNNMWESYLDYRDGLPEGQKKEDLKGKFKDVGKTSIFTEVKEKLDLWGQFVGTMDEVQKKKDYYKLFNQALDLLIKAKIIEVK